MSKPINTPLWLKKSRSGRPGIKFGRQWVDVQRSTPREAEVALELHAKKLAEDSGTDEIDLDLADADLKYRSKLFREYLIEARAIIKREQESKSEHEGGSRSQ